MAIILESELRRRGRNYLASPDSGTLAKSILNEAVAIGTARANISFDVFLSHTILDKDIVYGVLDLLSSHGHSVYVDWITDSYLDRSKVNKESAELIRARIKQCKSLLYLHSVNSPTSKWMPWECGYKDGENTRVAILPFAQASHSSFQGTEYLSLYPYVTEEETTRGTKRLFTSESPSIYCLFSNWLNGEKPTIHQ